MGTHDRSNLILRIVMLFVCIGKSRADTFTIGALLRQGPTFNEGTGFENVASAISIAVERFQDQGWLREHNFRYLHGDDKCHGKTSAYVVVTMFDKWGADVLLGGDCNNVVKPVGSFVSAYNRPYLPSGGTDLRLEDKLIYTCMIMSKGASHKMALSAHSLFKNFNWKTILMFTMGVVCDKIGLSVTNSYNKDVFLAELIKAPPKGFTDSQLYDYLHQFKQRGRIIMTCIDDIDWEHKFIRGTHAQGMASPDYVFLHMRQEPNEFALRPWEQGKAGSDPVQREQLKAIYTGHKGFSVAGVIETPAILAFYNRVATRLREPPWNYSDSYNNGWKGSPAAVLFHDMTWTYLSILNDSLAQGQDPRDGEMYLAKARNLRLQGLQSRVVFDDNGDREPDYWLLSLNPQQEQYVPALEVLMSEPMETRFVEREPVYWKTKDNAVPPDLPACGLQNELCPEDTTVRNAAIGGGVVGFALVSVSIGLWIYWYRKRKFETDIHAMAWKIPYEELELKKGGGRRRGSVAGMSVKSVSTGVSGGTEAKSGKADFGAATAQVFTDVAVFGGTKVAVCHVRKDAIFLTRADLIELKRMREMGHDNLNEFVGANPDPPHLCYMMAYCPKGSLQDIIGNDEIKLDWMFKISLMNDITNGLEYLHKSDIKSHGSLSSNNCLVDGRWVIKITGFGLKCFREGQRPREDMGEYEQYRRMLWTAPELLRLPSLPFYGSPKGDMYSFGIILQEAMFRALPYFLDTLTPKEVIERVRKELNPPYRPVCPEVDKDTKPEVMKLITLLWSENPDARPNWNNVKKHIKRLNNGKKVNVMDNMITKLERYANNLEEIVAQRTKELVAEKKKSDMLLYSMIPKSIAEDLKTGVKVLPEMYEAVTVFFSDVVGFVRLASTSSPFEVVDLLNDMYTVCDALIEQHNAYKVETISDSYMVVSGLPIRNGKQHVVEIATLSLDMMSAVMTKFKIRHRPGMLLQLRIGMHTGPCAAGVVGLAMPRYCLFGDTVNMASRMETNGKALRIHLSQSAVDALEDVGGFNVAPRGQMEIKGKGTQTTYWLLSQDEYPRPMPVPEE